LRYHLAIQVHPVFCTKIASKLARTYTQRHSLKDLVLELEQVELDKSAQSSDWGDVANLTPAQLSYAANDVRYLLRVREKLVEMLKREERWELAQQCFQCLPTIVSLDLLQFKDVFEH
jgi:ribonuclease D